MTEYNLNHQQQIINWGITKYEEKINEQIASLREQVQHIDKDIKKYAEEFYSYILDKIKEDFEPLIISIAHNKLKLYSYTEEDIDKIPISIKYDIRSEDFTLNRNYTYHLFLEEDYCQVRYIVKSTDQLFNITISHSQDQNSIKIYYDETSRRYYDLITTLNEEQHKLINQIDDLQEKIDSHNIDRIVRKLKADSFFNSLNSREQEELENQFDRLMNNNTTYLKDSNDS